jgi:ribokinase
MTFDVQTKFEVVGFAAVNEDRIKIVNHVVEEGEEFSRESPGKLRNDEKASLGGSVINTLTGLSKFGLSVAAIGKIGNDETWRRNEVKLRKHGIEFLGSRDERYHSSVAKIEVGTNKQRRIVIYPGVNDRIEWEDVEPYLNLVKSAKLFHSSTFACAYSYSSLKTQVKLAKTANKRSLSFGMLYCTLFDKQVISIEKLLKNTDILILNQQEVESLGKGNYREATRNLMKRYDMEIVAVTLGEKGSHVFGKDEDYFIEPHHVKVVDSTGAGDAWAAGFLAGYLRGRDLRTCGIWGNRNAERCIGTMGAVDYQIPVELV